MSVGLKEDLTHVTAILNKTFGLEFTKRYDADPYGDY